MSSGSTAKVPQNEKLIEAHDGDRHVVEDRENLQSLKHQKDRDSGISSSDGAVRDKQRNLLIAACKNGRLVDVRDIVEEGKLVPEQCNTGGYHLDTSLHTAAFHGHKDIVEYLIEEAKCDPEIRNAFKNTPLHRTARQGHLEVVKYLIEKQNCDPMCKCHWGRIPLHHACKHGRIEVVKYLMSNPNVNIHAKDSVDELTPLYLAAEFGALDVMKYMHEHGAGNEPIAAGTNTLLHIAAYKGQLDIVQYLIQDKGYDPLLKGKTGTSLHSACAGGQLNTVRYLVEQHQIDISCRESQYQLYVTPFPCYTLF